VGGEVTADGSGQSVGDWIVYTGSDWYWSGRSAATTAILGYSLSKDGDAAGGQSISNIKLQDGSPVARQATGNATSTGNQHDARGTKSDGLGREFGSNHLIGNEQANILNGGGVGNVGCDTLTGRGGADLFIVGSGYTGSSRNESGFRTGINTNRSSTILVKNRTDAQYAFISDFSSEDRLQLTGNFSQYFIGEAPTGFSEYNIGGGSPIEESSTLFGIYYVGDNPGSTNDIDVEPDLVASIQLTGSLGKLGNIATAGGIPIDGKDSTYNDPLHLGGNTASVIDTEIDFKDLGVGAMYNLQGSDFANRVDLVS
jgi:hypothetical protein